MKTVKNFTTTLPLPVLSWLDNIAEETNQNKNDIIENALKLWKKKYIQMKIASSYENAMSDSEWVNFGNSGMKDWGELEENKTKKPKPVLKNSRYA